MTIPESFSCDSFRPKIGILLAQLGTPDEPTPQAVKKYLREFLWDRRVVDVNRIFWFFILHGIILNTRPQKSALLYQRLHENYGPVLLTYCQSLTQKISNHFAQKNEEVIVRFGMRYGNPSLKSVVQDMVKNQNCSQVLLVPLYPQYCAATTGSTYDALNQEFLKWRWVPSLRVLPPFYNQSGYIQSLVNLFNVALEKRTQPPERIILSYHGIPQRYVDKGDPYACMCMDTTDAIKASLNFPKDKILHTYQSRFGKELWLKPYTDETLQELAKSGVKDVMIACPSFTMDCLETLDEIGVESQRLFRKNGGERLELVSCLNDDGFWVKNFIQMIESNLQGWI